MSNDALVGLGWILAVLHCWTGVYVQEPLPEEPSYLVTDQEEY